MDFKSLSDGLLLAARTRNQEAADRRAAQLNEILARQPETIAPLDEARYRLALVERELYRGTPAGAQAALDQLRTLEEDTRLGRVATREPSFYVLRAAALGQLYQHAKEAEDTAAMGAAAKEAINAIRFANAARQDEWVRELADPARTRNGDDDLVELAKDNAEVRSLLGLSLS